MSSDESATVQGLGHGFRVGLFLGTLIGLGHGLFSWDSKNIMPTGITVLIACTVIGLSIGLIIDRSERLKEEQRSAEIRQQEADRLEAKRRDREQTPVSLDELFTTIESMRVGMHRMTEYQKTQEMKAWCDRYHMRRIVGQGRVDDVDPNGTMTLLDSHNRRFTYAPGIKESDYAKRSKGATVQIDGKHQAVWYENGVRELQGDGPVDYKRFIVIVGWPD